MPAAFLTDTRANSLGAVSLLPLDSRHGECLTLWNRVAVAELVQEAVMEMLHM